MSQLAN